MPERNVNRDPKNIRDEDWKAHATHGPSDTEYPSVSFFQRGEKVWYKPSVERGMYGPYTVVEHKGNEMYIIRKDSDSVENPSPVSKAELQRV